MKFYINYKKPALFYNFGIYITILYYDSQKLLVFCLNQNIRINKTLRKQSIQSKQKGF